MKAAIECAQVLGGYGYTNEMPAEKLIRDAKIYQIYEGATEIQKMIIVGKLHADEGGPLMFADIRRITAGIAERFKRRFYGRTFHCPVCHLELAVVDADGNRLLVCPVCGVVLEIEEVYGHVGAGGPRRRALPAAAQGADPPPRHPRADRALPVRRARRRCFWLLARCCGRCSRAIAPLLARAPVHRRRDPRAAGALGRVCRS